MQWYFWTCAMVTPWHYLKYMWGHNMMFWSRAQDPVRFHTPHLLRTITSTSPTTPAPNPRVAHALCADSHWPGWTQTACVSYERDLCGEIHEAHVALQH